MEILEITHFSVSQNVAVFSIVQLASLSIIIDTHYCALRILATKALMECGASGKDASVNATRILRNWTSISKNEGCIFRCVRARLTAFTLLLGKLKPATPNDIFYPFILLQI